jgi:hypothetical protein
MAGSDMFSRSEKDMVENAPIKLFRIGGRDIKVRLRCASAVDEWIEDSDRVMELGQDVNFLHKRHDIANAKWLELKAQLETGGESPDAEVLGALAEILPGEAQVTESSGEESATTEADVQEAYQQYDAVRKVLRTKTREFLTAVFECVCAYDTVAIPREELLKHGVTDEQSVMAFTLLRFFSDPLVTQPRATAKALAGVGKA